MNWQSARIECSGGAVFHCPIKSIIQFLFATGPQDLCESYLLQWKLNVNFKENLNLMNLIFSVKCADFENDVAAKLWTWNSRFILQLKVGHFSKNTTSARPIDRYRDIKRRMSFSIPVGLPPGARWLHEKLEYPRDAGAPGVTLYFWTPWQRCNLSFPPKKCYSRTAQSLANNALNSLNGSDWINWLPGNAHSDWKVQKMNPISSGRRKVAARMTSSGRFWKRWISWLKWTQSPRSNWRENRRLWS